MSQAIVSVAAVFLILSIALTLVTYVGFTPHLVNLLAFHLVTKPAAAKSPQQKKWYYGAAAVLLAAAIVLFVVYSLFLSPIETVATISSRADWQPTQVSVKPGDRVQVKYIEGEWTPWGVPDVAYDAEGDTSFTCVLVQAQSTCTEPMADVHLGALIARIGKDNAFFAVGNDYTFVAETAGELELRMNDSDGGLFDNAGEITVEIIVSR